ncbi:MAG: DUF3140 domain-containing protein [Marmoricola sp.]
MAEVSDELWENFHRLVNMTSRELREWLMVEAAGEEAEVRFDEVVSSPGSRVLDILGKRRTDLTEDDVEVMQSVTERLIAERGMDPEPTAGEEGWRHGLMDIGHDPLKPVG